MPLAMVVVAEEALALAPAIPGRLNGSLKAGGQKAKTPVIHNQEKYSSKRRALMRATWNIEKLSYEAESLKIRKGTGATHCELLILRQCPKRPFLRHVSITVLRDLCIPGRFDIAVDAPTSGSASSLNKRKEVLFSFDLPFRSFMLIVIFCCFYVDCLYGRACRNSEPRDDRD